MPAAIQVSNAGVDDPAWLQAVIDALRPKLSLTGIVSSTGNSIAQAATPGPSQQSLTWDRLTSDINGEPIGRYRYFQGRWCREWTVPRNTMAFFHGVPTAFFNMTTGLGLFDGGTVGIAGDWYGWKLYVDGVSGNLRDRFPGAANRFNTGTGLWEMKMADGTFLERGGRTGTYLDDSEIPSLSITGREYDSGASAGTPRAVVSTKTSGVDITTDPAISGAINTAPVKLTAYPPFFAAGLVEFIGYVYTDSTIPI